MFGRKKAEVRTYDRENLTPALRCSICTGERVAGFRDRRDGRFKEVMLIRSDGDLAEFCRLYGLDAPPEQFY